MSKPEVGDVIVAEWPGSGPEEFAISAIRPDENGVLCAVFGKDGTVGAEAVEDLRLKDGCWRVKQ